MYNETKLLILTQKKTLLIYDFDVDCQLPCSSGKSLCRFCPLSMSKIHNASKLQLYNKTKVLHRAEVLATEDILFSKVATALCLEGRLSSCRAVILIIMWLAL